MVTTGEARPTVCLRMDDIGASSKRFEVYSDRLGRLGNFLWFKYLPWFRAWGRYREMEPGEWDEVYGILSRHGAKLTVAVTACWVEHDGSLVPFPEKFPSEAAKLKEGVESGLIEIANHGLTHCVTDGFRFRPRPFSSNRKFHREFWDWVPKEVHFENLMRSQGILQGFFGLEIATLVPPGNVFCESTIRACAANGIRRINCNIKPGTGKTESEIRIIGNENVLAFHDRELVLEGAGWLERRLNGLPPGTIYKFVSEL